eukprot:2446328-Amphidinium_carterae.1
MGLRIHCAEGIQSYDSATARNMLDLSRGNVGSLLCVQSYSNRTHGVNHACKDWSNGWENKLVTTIGRALDVGTILIG